MDNFKVNQKVVVTKNGLVTTGMIGTVRLVFDQLVAVYIPTLGRTQDYSPLSLSPYEDKGAYTAQKDNGEFACGQKETNIGLVLKLPVGPLLKQGRMNDDVITGFVYTEGESVSEIGRKLMMKPQVKEWIREGNTHLWLYRPGRQVKLELKFSVAEVKES